MSHGPTVDGDLPFLQIDRVLIGDLDNFVHAIESGSPSDGHSEFNPNPSYARSKCYCWNIGQFHQSSPVQFIGAPSESEAISNFLNAPATGATPQGAHISNARFTCLQYEAAELCDDGFDELPEIDFKSSKLCLLIIIFGRYLSFVSEHLHKLYKILEGNFLECY